MTKLCNVFHDDYNKNFYICILVVLTFIALPFGSHDFRWLFAVFFWWSCDPGVLYMFTYNSMYFVLTAIIVVMIVLLLVLFQALRPDVSGYAYSTTIILMLLSMWWYVSLSGYDVASFKGHNSVYTCFYTVAVVVALIPIACFCFIVVVRIKTWLLCKEN